MVFSPELLREGQPKSISVVLFVYECGPLRFVISIHVGNATVFCHLTPVLDCVLTVVYEKWVRPLHLHWHVEID